MVSLVLDRQPGFLFHQCVAVSLCHLITGQEDDPSDYLDELDDASGDIMDLDADHDLEESSPDSHVRHLRPAWPWPNNGGFPGGFPERFVPLGS